MAKIKLPEPMCGIRSVDTRGHAGQRGVTLVVSLLFLLLMTILGVTALNTSTLQEKMAGNLRDQDLAFQSAESALRAGERALVDIAYASIDARPGDATCATGICAQGIAQPMNDAWWNSNSIEFGGTGPDLGVADDPRYAIEFAQEVSTGSARKQQGYGNTVSTDHYYRVTSRAVGATRTAGSALESHFRMKFN